MPHPRAVLEPMGSGSMGTKTGHAPCTPIPPPPLLPSTPKSLTHISLLAKGLGQSCVGSVASMISLKRVFPMLTAS